MSLPGSSRRSVNTPSNCQANFEPTGLFPRPYSLQFIAYILQPTGMFPIASSLELTSL